MNDRAWLLVTAACASGAAWAFWHFLDQDAFGVLTLLALIILGADNFRLRRKCRELGAQAFRDQ
jgi:hypothetical protein